jgi:hypothetical protein
MFKRQRVKKARQKIADPCGPASSPPLVLSLATDSVTVTITRGILKTYIYDEPIFKPLIK